MNDPTLSVQKSQEWREVYTSYVPYFHFPVKEIWNRKFLLYLFVRQRIVERYKQTILGPAWLVIQPLLSTFIFVVIFNKILHLDIGQAPPLLFYMLGTIVWLFFSGSFMGISAFLTGSAHILTKVNFPKHIIPISHMINMLIVHIIQLFIFLCFYTYYVIYESLSPNLSYMLLLPVLYITLILFSLGAGYIFSCLSVKYRDLANIYTYIIQALMYVTPVVYPLHTIVDERKRFLLQINPLSGIFEGIRYAFLGEGYVSWGMLLYSIFSSILIFLVGIFFLSRIERVYADVVSV